VPESVLLKKNSVYNTDEIVAHLGLPVFVKPNAGGSSFGTTKVKDFSQLDKAVANAFDESSEVIVESFIAGTEGNVWVAIKPGKGCKFCLLPRWLAITSFLIMQPSIKGK